MKIVFYPPGLVVNPEDRYSHVEAYVGLDQVNLSSGVCEQHRGRPAWASAQSDQRLCYLRFGKYHI